jgi:hypothetical protein
MIRIFKFLIFLPLLAFIPKTQKPDYIVKTDAEKMTTDNIGNVYLIKGESIFKCDSAGVVQKSFSNKNFGAITSADATNALRIILFYKDFNRVVTLDNTMSQNGEPIALETIGFPLASLVAASHDNGMWIYDPANFELVRLNRNLQIENRSGNLSQILGIDLQPNFIIEKDNRLFLNNPSTGILIFDVFGTYSKTIPEKNLKNFQISDDNIIYYRKPEMAEVNVLTLEKTFFEGIDSTAIAVRFEKNAVFVLKEKELDIFNKK